MLRILLAVTALLIYGSLYPWHFHAGPGSGGPVDALLHSWQISFNRFILRDIALNVAIYVPFGAAAYLWLHSRPAAIRFGVPVLLGAVLSTSIELVQFYDTHRFTSLLDVATNVAGATLGMLLAAPVARRRSAQAIRIAQPGALLLFGCWAGAMLFPLIPDFSRTHLLEKLSGVFRGGFTMVSMFSMFVTLLAAGRMLLELMGEGSAGIVFPLLGLALPARLLISGLTAGWTYWAAFAAAWFIWMAFFADSRRPDAVLATLLVFAIVLNGLSPFHFTPEPQRFDWVPFRALFSTDWESGFAVFLRKIFLYGSLIWLLHTSRLRLSFAAMLTAAGLAAIEGVQRFLPNHAPEITDPLLALLIAWVLHRLSRAVTPSVNGESGGATLRPRTAKGFATPSRL